MVDWMAIWGVSQAAGMLVFPIMQDLAKESAKDYLKGFFKNSLTNVLRSKEKDTQKEAYGKAIKAFLEVFQQQLESVGLSDEEVDSLKAPLTIFIKDETVTSTLGNAFETDCQLLDTSTLAQTWEHLDLPPLPKGFNWELVGKFYLRKVKEIISTSEKLKDIFLFELKYQDSQNLQELGGVKPEYDLDRYAEGLQKEYGHLKLECLDTTTYEKIKLRKIFIPQKVKRCFQFIPQLFEIPKEKRQELVERGEIDQEALEFLEKELEERRKDYFKQPLYPVLEIIDSTTPNKIVFLGDPGSGKSSLLQYIALCWAEKERSDRAFSPFPLLVELRIYARDKEKNNCKDFLEFFHKGNIFCHLNQNSLNYKLKNGKTIVLFDGLDEIFDPERREVIVTDLKRFSLDYPKVKIIVTSRWLGYKAEKLDNAGFHHFMLQDLEPEQMAKFIQCWHNLAFQDRADKILKEKRLQVAIAESKAIRELAGNPLLLTMMAILNRTQELPRDRPELYKRASEVLLHEWDFEAKEDLKNPELKKFTSKIDARDKKAILRAVANAMQAGEKGLAANLIYREDLETILTSYLKSIKKIGEEDAIALGLLITEQLRYRNFILCLLGGNSFAFVHRTFLEYFCASQFYELFKDRDIQNGSGITLEQLKIEVFSKHWADSSWSEVFRLLIGMMSAEYPKVIAEELIHCLIEQKGEKAEFANIFLAADCFSELRNRALYDELGKRLLEQLQSLLETEVIPTIGKQSFYDKVISKIGTVWQDEVEGWKTLQVIAKPKSYWEGGKQAVEQLTKIAKIHPQALPILQEVAIKGESSAIEALAEYWRDDPQTLPLIRQLAYKENQAAKSALRRIETPYEGGHFSTLRTKIRDGEILKATLRDLGITVKTEADVRGSNGQRVRVDIVAVLDGEYDLGWGRNSDGSFYLIADLWGVAKKHNQTELVNSIMQRYAICKILTEIKQRNR